MGACLPPEIHPGHESNHGWPRISPSQASATPALASTLAAAPTPFTACTVSRWERKFWQHGCLQCLCATRFSAWEGCTTCLSASRLLPTSANGCRAFTPLNDAAHPAAEPWLKTAAQGAATTVYAATAPELRGKSGVYLEDCQEAKRELQQRRGSGWGPWVGCGIGKQADPVAAHACGSMPAAALGTALLGYPPFRSLVSSTNSLPRPLPCSLPPCPAAWRCARDADMARKLWDKSEELVQAALVKAGLA